jgi:excisionase family DNA binding protein
MSVKAPQERQEDPSGATAVDRALPRELRDLPATLTVEQAARILRIGRNQAYEAVACGGLPAIRFGRRWIVPTVRLLRLLGVGADEDMNHEVAQ